jgi:transcription elongation factor GreA
LQHSTARILEFDAAPPRDVGITASNGKGATVDTAAHENDPILMTPEGYDRLLDELDVLCTERREEVAEWLRAAREDGSDPSENGDLAHALQEQDWLERRISQLETILALARVVAPIDDGTAGIGTRVRVRRENCRVVQYELVGVSEANASEDRISIASPVGRALTGRAPGDVVDVKTPRGLKRLEVVAVDGIVAPLAPA